jgi:hypothetical protein
MARGNEREKSRADKLKKEAGVVRYNPRRLHLGHPNRNCKC